MATKRVDTKNPVVREILRQGKGKDPRLVAAALETGRIETNFQNLPGGDADSVNWRQERASIYGGDMSIRRSVARFYNEAAGLDRGQPSYELAADVQRPAAQYRGRYKNAQGEALGILKGGSQAPPQSPSSPAYQSVTTTTPGVDNSTQRRLAVASFLQQGGVKNASAVTQLAGTYRQLADVPGTTSTQRVKTPASPSSRGTGSPQVDSTVEQLKQEMQTINDAKVPYLWGGGHGGKQSRGSKVAPLDCSGAVSRALGIDPRVSGQFTQWGKPGKGSRVTVYANNEHVLMEVDGHFWGTSASNPGGGAGWVPKAKIPASYLSKFTARHPPGA